MNSTYNQAHLPKSDSEERSFAGYILTWCEFPKHLHKGVRRQILVGPIAGKNCFGFQNVNVWHLALKPWIISNEAFDAGFDRLEQYVAEVQKDLSKYEGTKVIEIFMSLEMSLSPICMTKSRP